MPTIDKILSSASIHPPENIDFSLIDSLDITEITSETLQDYFADLYDNKGVRGALYSKCKEYVASILEYAKQNGYISEVPRINLRSEKNNNRFNKPDTEIIEQILLHSKGLPVETIVRLAWECGLARAEIPILKYDQIDFENAEIILADRKVPIRGNTLQFLEELKSSNQLYSDYVLLSQKKEAPMAEQSISRIVRSELDKYGQRDIKFSDLRMDFIINCLKKHNLEYVSYITGVDIRTLQTQYLPHVDEVAEADKVDKVKTLDYNSIYEFMISEKDSITGLALWFVWQLGMTVTDLTILTWNMVDFDNAKIAHHAISDDLLILLRNLKAKNGQYSDHIFLTDNTKKPMDREYISKISKKTFIQNGFLDFSFSKLCKEYSPRIYSLKKELTEYLKENRHADSNTIAKALDLTVKDTGKLLRDLRDAGDIVLVGKMYFLRGTVVSPEKQDATILKYVKEHPYATRKELSELLGLASRRQLLPIVNPLIEQGRLKRTADQKYCLPELLD